MEQIPYASTQSIQSPVGEKRPLGVTITSWVLILAGIFGLLRALLTLLLGSLWAGNAAVFGVGILSLVEGVVSLIATFGIWKMRRWGLQTTVVLMILETLINLHGIVTYGLRDPLSCLYLIFSIVILVYMLKISKKFT